jgi:L-ascorbate metabolism protein UlaG (beta-lactamase superfamily)
MKITKLGHSCLLVEMPAPLNRTALFDPGVFSKVDVKGLAYLDDIFITHIHADHMDPELMKKLVTKFPEARITATPEIVTRLKDQGIIAHSEPPEGAVFFDSPQFTTGIGILRLAKRCIRLWKKFLMPRALHS